MNSITRNKKKKISMPRLELQGAHLMSLDQLFHIFLQFIQSHPSFVGLIRQSFIVGL